MSRPVALVTGASRGIGRAVARNLGRDHHVLVGATTAEGAERVVAELPSAEPFVADLTDPASVERAVAGAFPSLADAKLDVIVHSAGAWAHSTVADADRGEWTRLLNLNVVAVVDLTRRVLPALRNAAGTVVAINSGSGFHSGAGQGLYSASKFALRAVTDALREEERGVVRVSSVHPGRVDTDMQIAIQGEEDYDGSRYVHVDSIAAAVRLCVDATDDCTVEEITVRPRK